MVTLDEGARVHGQVRIFPPPRGLADVAEFSWIDCGPGPGPDPPRRFCRIVPDHAPHVICHGLASGRCRVDLVGARTRFVDVDRLDRRWTVGIRLRPGAIPVLFRRPAKELTDRSVALEDVLDRGTRSTCSAFDASEVPEAAHEVLRAVLIAQHAARRDRINARIRYFIACPPSDPARVTRAASTLGVSDRTLRALSAFHLGMGLKRVLRVRRLHEALFLRLHAGEATWSRVAARTGFADQAHLVREFHDLLGETPAAFARRGW